MCSSDLEDIPQIGDWVLIHVGFAMSKISEQDAVEQMQLLTMLGEGETAMDEVRGYGLEETAELRSVRGSPGTKKDRPLYQ